MRLFASALLTASGFLQLAVVMSLLPPHQMKYWRVMNASVPAVVGAMMCW